MNADVPSLAARSGVSGSAGHGGETCEKRERGIVARSEGPAAFTSIHLRSSVFICGFKISWMPGRQAFGCGQQLRCAHLWSPFHRSGHESRVGVISTAFTPAPVLISLARCRRETPPPSPRPQAPTRGGGNVSCGGPGRGRAVAAVNHGDNPGKTAITWACAPPVCEQHGALAAKPVDG
jgi:hypothetical protein